MSPQALGSHLLDDQEGDTNSRVQNIKQKILLIDKINKAVIAEQPSCGPWVKKHERIPGENEARLTPHDHPATPGFFPPKGVINNGRGGRTPTQMRAWYLWNARTVMARISFRETGMPTIIVGLRTAR
jgi:hypothetical protein